MKMKNNNKQMTIMIIIISMNTIMIFIMATKTKMIIIGMISMINNYDGNDD